MLTDRYEIRLNKQVQHCRTSLSMCYSRMSIVATCMHSVRTSTLELVDSFGSFENWQGIHIRSQQDTGLSTSANICHDAIASWSFNDIRVCVDGPPGGIRNTQFRKDGLHNLGCLFLLVHELWAHVKRASGRLQKFCQIGSLVGNFVLELLWRMRILPILKESFYHGVATRRFTVSAIGENNVNRFAIGICDGFYVVTSGSRRTACAKGKSRCRCNDTRRRKCRCQNAQTCGKQLSGPHCSRSCCWVDFSSKKHFGLEESTILLQRRNTSESTIAMQCVK